MLTPPAHPHVAHPHAAHPPALVSGPVSAHVFDVPVVVRDNDSNGRTHRVFIFGDEHFRYDNMCSPCRKKDGCEDIVAFVQRLVDEPPGGSLDVLLEMPYVVRSGPLRTRWLKRLDAVMRSDPEHFFRATASVFGVPASIGDERSSSSSRYKDIKRMMSRLLGETPKGYIGVFSQLYRRFSSMLYDDDVKSTTRRRGVRFHYCDARHEPHVELLLPSLDPANFHRHVRTLGQLRALLHAFLLAEDFHADISGVFGRDRANALVVPDALSSMGGKKKNKSLHKIAKQFHLIPDAGMKLAARRYIEDRIEDALHVMEHDLGMEDGAYTVAAAAAAGEQEGSDARHGRSHYSWLHELRMVHGKFYDVFFPLVMSFTVHMLLMDAYLICRMLRFVCGNAGGATVVYAGDAHAEHYVSFLHDYVGLRPTVCEKMRDVLPPNIASYHHGVQVPVMPPSRTSRCVAMRFSQPADRTASCPTLGRNPMRRGVTVAAAGKTKKKRDDDYRH